MGAHSDPAASTFDPRTGGDRLAAARAGEDPTVIAKLRSGYVALGEAQFLPGYCQLFADADGAEHLGDLSREARDRFLTDMGLLGEALTAACAAWDPAFSRLDYELSANGERLLRADVIPRYSWEPTELREASVWHHPAQRWSDPAYALGEEHDRLVEAITRELSRVTAEAY